MPGMSIMYQVRRTGRRSKNISVRVYHDGERARRRAELGELRARYVASCRCTREWIAERVAEAKAMAPCYDDGALQFFLGKRYPIAFELPAERDAVSFSGRRFVVATHDRTADARSRPAARVVSTPGTRRAGGAHRSSCADLPWLDSVAELAPAPHAIAVGQLHGDRRRHVEHATRQGAARSDRLRDRARVRASQTSRPRRRLRAPDGPSHAGLARAAARSEHARSGDSRRLTFHISIGSYAAIGSCR